MIEIETQRRLGVSGSAPDATPVAAPAPREARPAEAQPGEAQPGEAQSGPHDVAEIAAADPTPVVRRRYVRFRADAGQPVEDEIIAEIRLSIFVDGQELVQLMCSPHQVRALVVGFLYLEGLIDSLDDVDALRVCLADRVAEVRLARPLASLPTRRIVTSGCTGGVSFGAYLEELDRLRLPIDRVRVTPAQVYAALRALYDRAALYHRSGGVHTSILVEPGGGQDPRADGVLAVAEDVGRHNTIDKLQGEALTRHLPTRGRMIVSSGRISSEMLLKAAVMGVPLVGSRTSPTQLAVQLAERLGITVIGYIRSASMNVYSYPYRVVGAPLA
ncbi:MAG: formate dehydrogenase accessory sulfurtransferase FdhD [Chloroflexi bacterium]|nr:formate dehydrogenase accessory sulfurtransferase FdhD [Chloroflexota bacterium]